MIIIMKTNQQKKNVQTKTEQREKGNAFLSSIKIIKKQKRKKVACILLVP